MEITWVRRGGGWAALIPPRRILRGGNRKDSRRKDIPDRGKYLSKCTY
jgi:hypothetical protein